MWRCCKNKQNHIYHSNSLACQGHFREEGRYGGGRYFEFARATNQKRPDVHKIVLSIKSRFPPPRKKCQFWGFYADLYSFSSFWALFGGGGVKPNFADTILWTPRLFWTKIFLFLTKSLVQSLASTRCLAACAWLAESQLSLSLEHADLERWGRSWPCANHWLAMRVQQGRAKGMQSNE